MKAPSPGIQRRLQSAARRAAKSSYSPYSKFPVGAAVLTGRGKVFVGCNVENASYGLCNCAERTAIFSAVAAGERTIRAIAIYTPTATATAPCGACRQVINEFGPDALVISVCDSDASIAATMAELLPHRFGPQDLASAKAR
ncbi:MAG TPA: cytidine deaminase [Opitutaceae bacterium]|nr:cytidine deaminase [Opitutaceae bacterium]